MPTTNESASSSCCCSSSSSPGLPPGNNGRYKGHAFTGGRGNGIILQDLTLIVYQQQEKHLVQKTDLDEFIQKEIDIIDAQEFLLDLVDVHVP